MKINITYIFTFESGRSETFSLDFDEETMTMLTAPPSTPKSWTALEFCQCSHCPLQKEHQPHCPPALQLQHVVQHIGDEFSFTEIILEVQTAERRIRTKTFMSSAFASLMGLVMATTGCPYANFFRPMARFHLPLASGKETAFRAITTYLMGQYFQKRNGLDFDYELQGLKKIYKDMETVNAGFSQRLLNSGQLEEINSLVSLDLHAKNLPFIIEDAAEEFAKLFSALN